MMNNMKKMINIYQIMEEGHKDPQVGIKIVKLQGSSDYALYAGEIDGYKRVGAHYHTQGSEIYQVLEGSGKMYFGKPTAASVEWQSPIEVTAGDCFTVEENQAHQLVNPNPQRLVILFICPEAHLSSDRIIVEGIKEI